MAFSMGLGPVLSRNDLELKRSFRWMLEIGSGNDSVVGNSANVLPPLSGSRPGLTFKEIELEHVTETVFVPSKAQWKPMKVKVYDYAQNLKNNLVFDWVVKFYNSPKASYKFMSKKNVGNFKKTANLSMYSGCNGCCLETWTMEGCWPKDIEWGELDMANGGIVTIDMELRYDRAYVTTYMDSGKINNAGNADVRL